MIVVKQSMPVILSGLIGMIALIIPIFSLFSFKAYDNIYLASDIDCFNYCYDCGL